MATCLAETILEAAASSGFTKLSEREKLSVMLQSIYEASGSSDDLDTLMDAAASAGFCKVSSNRYKACILLQLMVSLNGTTTTASSILSNAALSQFMFLSETSKRDVFLQMMCDINDIDPDAADFISRAGITDSTQISAVNQLVVSLKSESLWDKILLLYPFVGGSEASHAQNLKSSSFTISWVNASVHNSNGVTGNGTNSYGNTNFDPSSNGLSDGNYNSFWYSSVSTNPTPFAYLWCATSHGYSRRLGAFRDSGTATLIDGGTNCTGAGIGTVDLTTPGTSDFSGWYNIGRKDGSTVYGLGHLIAYAEYAVTLTGAVTNDLFLLARNAEGAAANWVNYNFSLFCLGEFLTSSECSALAAAVTTYQTTLGRNI